MCIRDRHMTVRHVCDSTKIVGLVLVRLCWAYFSCINGLMEVLAGVRPHKNNGLDNEQWLQLRCDLKSSKTNSIVIGSEHNCKQNFEQQCFNKCFCEILCLEKQTAL
eukprot:2827480-Amphidinium_carterae.1